MQERALPLVVLIVGHLSFEKHALMQNAGYQDASSRSPVEHNVTAMFHATQAGTNRITGSA